MSIPVQIDDDSDSLRTWDHPTLYLNNVLIPKATPSNSDSHVYTGHINWDTNKYTWRVDYNAGEILFDTMSYV
jgi:hypothetical protein